ncbi:MAG: TonB-dependent receptor [Candidatus Kapabacteria bacterium]|nr:TonB-dependent receptor [Candidatus Kapabacteria bacterium]
MKKNIICLAIVLLYSNIIFGQTEMPDTTKIFRLNNVIVTASRMPVALKNIPASVSMVTPEMLSIMPKTIAVDEALRLIPGVRIDNQHGGERVHLSIRGQGILTERGLRGIGVFIDGIPVNDPSGFAPDLYDVDWATVSKIEVLRGPSAGLYGGSSSGGVLNIYTQNGGSKPFGGEISQSIGSNGFWKSLVQVDGSKDIMDYRLTYSHSAGDGYRDHQAFWANNFYEKVNFYPSDKLYLTQIISHIDYFHQNPEGLNLTQFDNLSQANPDARPFNEYQKTNRTTVGMHGLYRFNDMHDVEATGYLRNWNYKETSNKAAEYRTISNPGASLQYNFHLLTGAIKNDFSIGADYKYQNIGMYKLQSGSDPNRKESTDETNIELNNLLANQVITQDNLGAFFMYKMQFNKLTFMGSVRYDDITNKLTDKMLGGDTAVTIKDFSKTSVRIGASYNFIDAFTLFANWSQGFIPPSTEELASNPVGYSGFNTHLVPATSNSIDIGGRGFIGDKFYYELTGFLMNTENDFFRFKQSGRGNQEVFYGNAGNSRRIGIEAAIAYDILDNLKFQVAYTYANYKYTSATIDPIYADTAYVLTTPPAKDQWLPNSPQHQLFAELDYTVIKNLKLTLETEYQSKWAIYTDAKAYNGELDPTIYQNWQDGFNLYHFGVSYQFKLWNLDWECSIFLRNMFDKTYMAFTEPDPDGNSYQPGPGREIFGNIKIKL